MLASAIMVALCHPTDDLWFLCASQAPQFKQGHLKAQLFLHAWAKSVFLSMKEYREV